MSRKNMFVLIVVVMLAALLSACGPDDCKPGMAVSPSTGEACPSGDGVYPQRDASKDVQAAKGTIDKAVEPASKEFGKAQQQASQNLSDLTQKSVQQGVKDAATSVQQTGKQMQQFNKAVLPCPKGGGRDSDGDCIKK